MKLKCWKWVGKGLDVFLGRNGSTTRGQWQRDALRLSREPKGERSTDGSQDVELGSGRWGLTVFLQKMKNLLRVLSHPSPSLCFTGAGFWFSNWDPRPLLGFLTHLLSACRQVVVVKVSRDLNWDLWERSRASHLLLRSSATTTISSPNVLWKPLLFRPLICPEFSYLVRWTIRLGGWPRVKDYCFGFDVWRKLWDGATESSWTAEDRPSLCEQRVAHPPLTKHTPTGLKFMSKGFHEDNDQTKQKAQVEAGIKLKATEYDKHFKDSSPYMVGVCWQFCWYDPWPICYFWMHSTMWMRWALHT